MWFSDFSFTKLTKSFVISKHPYDSPTVGWEKAWGEVSPFKSCWGHWHHFQKRQRISKLLHMYNEGQFRTGLERVCVGKKHGNLSCVGLWNKKALLLFWRLNCNYTIYGSYHIKLVLCSRGWYLLKLTVFWFVLKFWLGMHDIIEQYQNRPIKAQNVNIGICPIWKIMLICLAEQCAHTWSELLPKLWLDSLFWIWDLRIQKQNDASSVQ